MQRYLVWLISGLIVLCLAGCDNRPKEIKNTWQEEIQLQDGKVIWVDRSVDFTQKVGAMREGYEITKVEITITIPTTSFAPALPN